MNFENIVIDMIFSMIISNGRRDERDWVSLVKGLGFWQERKGWDV